MNKEIKENSRIVLKRYLDDHGLKYGAWAKKHLNVSIYKMSRWINGVSKPNTSQRAIISMETSRKGGKNHHVKIHDWDI